VAKSDIACTRMGSSPWKAAAGVRMFTSSILVDPMATSRRPRWIRSGSPRGPTTSCGCSAGVVQRPGRQRGELGPLGLSRLHVEFECAGSDDERRQEHEHDPTAVSSQPAIAAGLRWRVAAGPAVLGGCVVGGDAFAGCSAVRARPAGARPPVRRRENARLVRTYGADKRGEELLDASPSSRTRPAVAIIVRFVVFTLLAQLGLVVRRPLLPSSKGPTSSWSPESTIATERAWRPATSPTGARRDVEPTSPAGWTTASFRRALARVSTHARRLVQGPCISRELPLVQHDVDAANRHRLSVLLQRRQSI